VNDQQPSTPAANPPHTGQPTTPPGQSTPPTPKSNKTLVIILVLVVLLLCGCCALVGGGLIFYNSLGDSGESGASDATRDPELEAAALAAWTDRDASTGTYDPVAPTARQQALAEEILSDLHPDFQLVELGVLPGRYDPETDGYVADEYVLRAAMIDDPAVEIGLIAHVPSSAAVAAGDPTMDTAGVSEYYAPGTLADGTQYVYNSDHTAHVGGAVPDELKALFFTALEQWPGAVISGVKLGPTPEDGVRVGLMTWDEYRSTADFQGAEVIYIEQDGEWFMDSYEIAEPE
jgi:hypothetical protein